MAGDVDGIVGDYADDAVFITPAGIKRGKEGAREGFTQLLNELPNAKWEVPTTIFEGDLLFIEWKADAGSTRVEDGVGHLPVPRGRVRAQTTVRYTLIGA